MRDAIADVRALRDKLIYFSKVVELFDGVAADALYTRTRFDDLDLDRLLEDIERLVARLRDDRRPARLITNPAAEIFDRALVAEVPTRGEFEGKGRALMPTPARCEKAIRLLHFHATTCWDQFVLPIERIGSAAARREEEARAARHRREVDGRRSRSRGSRSSPGTSRRSGRDGVPTPPVAIPVEQLPSAIRVELSRRRDLRRAAPGA